MCLAGLAGGDWDDNIQRPDSAAAGPAPAAACALPSWPEPEPRGAELWSCGAVELWSCGDTILNQRGESEEW